MMKFRLPFQMPKVPSIFSRSAKIRDLEDKLEDALIRLEVAEREKKQEAFAYGQYKAKLLARSKALEQDVESVIRTVQGLRTLNADIDLLAGGVKELRDLLAAPPPK